MGRCNALRFQAANVEFKGLLGMHPWDSGEKDCFLPTIIWMSFLKEAALGLTLVGWEPVHNRGEGCQTGH